MSKPTLFDEKQRGLPVFLSIVWRNSYPKESERIRIAGIPQVHG